jgi:hypothetical protein
MNIINLLIENKLQEAKDLIYKRLTEKSMNYLDEAKQYIALEQLEENHNIVRMGRIHKIRKRVRRDAKGRIIVQTNRTRSAIKGYMVSGRSIKRISAYDRMRRSQALKRQWKSSRRARLSRTLLKRKMSMRRRYSLGLR